MNDQDSTAVRPVPEEKPTNILAFNGAARPGRTTGDGSPGRLDGQVQQLRARLDEMMAGRVTRQSAMARLRSGMAGRLAGLGTRGQMLSVSPLAIAPLLLDRQEAMTGISHESTGAIAPDFGAEAAAEEARAPLVHALENTVRMVAGQDSALGLVPVLTRAHHLLRAARAFQSGLEASNASLPQGAVAEARPAGAHSLTPARMPEAETVQASDFAATSLAAGLASMAGRLQRGAMPEEVVQPFSPDAPAPSVTPVKASETGTGTSTQTEDTTSTGGGGATGPHGHDGPTAPETPSTPAPVSPMPAPAPAPVTVPAPAPAPVTVTVTPPVAPTASQPPGSQNPLQSPVFSLTDSHAPSGFSYHRQPDGSLIVMQVQNGVDTAVARIDGADGHWVTSPLAPVIFDAGQGDSDISLPIEFTVTGADGTVTTSTFSVTFDDTAPVPVPGRLAFSEGFGSQQIASTEIFSAADGVAGAFWSSSMTAPRGFQYLRDGNDPSGATLVVRQEQNGTWVTVMTLVLDKATGKIGITGEASLLEDGSDGGVTRLGFDFEVSDRDGDTRPGHVDIDVTRLGVTLGTGNVLLDEGAAPGRAEVVAFTATHGVQDIEWLTTGAPTGFSYALDASDPSGRTLLVSDGTRQVARLVIDAATGKVTVDATAAFDHAPGNNGQDSRSFDLTFRLHDDHGTHLDSHLVLTIRDSVPEIGTASRSITESAVTEVLTGMLTLGAPDGVAGIRWQTGTGPQGVTFVLDPADATGHTLLISQGGVTRMIATLDPATGGYALKSLAPLDHGALSSLELDLAFDVEDGDGDVVTGHLVFEVADTTPVVTSQSLTITERFGTQSVTQSAFSAVDGARDAVWRMGGTPPTGFRYVRDAGDASGATLLVQQSQNGAWATILTLALDKANGTFIATQNGTIAGLGGGTSRFDLDFDVTDRDGDSAAGHVTLDVNRLGVQFQTPRLGLVENGAAQHLEQVIFTASNSVASAEWLATGAPAGFAYVLDPAAADNRTLLVMQGGTEVARVRIDTATGKMILDQGARLLHAAGGGLNDQFFTFTYRLHDANGTHADSQISLTVRDSVPVFSPVVRTFDESPISQSFSGRAFSAFDGVDTVRWKIDNPPAGAVYVLDPADASGCRLLIKQGGVTRMIATLDPETGDYALSVLKPFDHSIRTPLQMDLSFEVTDRDGDTGTGHVIVSINDTVPTLVTTPVTVSEVPGMIHNIALFSAVDGIASARWMTTGAPTGYSYVLDAADASGKTLLIQYGGVTHMVARLDTSTGLYSLTAIKALTHTGQQPLTLRLSFEVTDRDGDTVSGQATVTVTDTAPVVQVSPGTLVEGLSPQSTVIATLSASDGLASVAWDLAAAPSGFVYQRSGNDMLIRQMQDGVLVTVMTASCNLSTGKVTVTLNHAIDHAGNGLSETFTLRFTATDKDGSATIGNSSLTVGDDGGPDVLNLSLTQATLLSTQTYFGNWSVTGGQDRITRLKVSYGGVTRILDTTDADNEVVIAGADGTAIVFRADGTYSLNPGLNYDGAIRLTLTAYDSDGDSVAATIRRDVDFINHAPIINADPVMLYNRLPHVITFQELGYFDPDGNNLASIEVTDLVDNGGVLKLNGADVTIGTRISAADILAGKLTLVLPVNATIGDHFTTSFTATDDGGALHGGHDTSGTFDMTFNFVSSAPTQGSVQGDIVTLGPNNDNYDALGGSDVVDAGGGDDTVNGGTGNDTIFGGSGRDVLTGGDGDDELHGGTNVDYLYGGSGDDILYGDSGLDKLYGGIGNDELHGGDDRDNLYGGVGNDTIYGDGGSDYIYGEDGTDEIWGGAGDNQMWGGGGADVFHIDPVQRGTSNDYIRDYNFAEGDIIDVSDIISGMTGDISLEANGYASLYTIGDNTYIRLAPTSTASSTYAVYVILSDLIAANEQIRVRFMDTHGQYHTDLL